MNLLIIFSLLLLAHTPMANAIDFPVTTLQGNESRAYIRIVAFRGKYLARGDGRLTFASTEPVNIVATVGAEPEDIGLSAPLYIIAIANGSAYIKTSSGQWVLWDGSLQAIENRTLKAFESLEIVFGLKGISGDIDIYVGYGKPSGDVVYNKNPLSLQIKNYSSILTVGEHGQYSDCNGLQLALNTAKDLSEVRIEQGTYHCNGLVIASAKHFEYGIKVSGGWNSDFETQTKNPALTIIDGSAHLIQGFESISACFEIETINKLRQCFHDDVITGAILTINTEPVTIEMLTFQNGYSGYRGESSSGAITSDEINFDIEINQCQFQNNTGVAGGAVSRVNSINHSVFKNNYANGGGAVSAVDTVSNSKFSHNTAGLGGGVHLSRILINNLFYSNTAVTGGAVAKVGFVVNNTFANNTAGNGGAFSGGGTILNSIFSENKAANQDNDIDSGGGLFIDYSLFNHLSGGTDLGLHNVTGDALFIDPANANFQMQASSPARNAGNNVLLEKNIYINPNNDIFTYYYDYPQNNAGISVGLEGNIRSQGSSIDIGAYEYNE